MVRNWRSEGLVLKNSRFGESNKIVTLFLPEHGVRQAFAYGAYSKNGSLRGSTNPFTQGMFTFYEDPVKATLKITGVEVHDYHHIVREDFDCFFSAGLWVEVVLKSHAGGNSRQLFDLVSDGLAALAGLPSRQRPALHNLVLWRILGDFGEQPQLEQCAVGESAFSRTETAYFSRTQGAFVSGGYAGDDDVAISAGARAYLRATEGLPLAAALSVALDEGSAQSLRTVLHALLTRTLATRIATLEIGSLAAGESVDGRLGR